MENRIVGNLQFERVWIQKLGDGTLGLSILFQEQSDSLPLVAISLTQTQATEMVDAIQAKLDELNE